MATSNKFHIRVITPKKFLVLVSFTLLCVTYVWLRLHHFFDVENPPPPRPIKYILYWSPFWKFPDYHMGVGHEPFKNCAKYKNCYATADRNLIPLEDFDALLFHASTYKKSKHGVPPERFPHQKYVFVNLEAPVYITPNLKGYDGYFNWTMTYRYDSDVVRRHGYFFEEETGYVPPNLEDVKRKGKLAAWFVSNCKTGSLRELLNKAIQKQMDVDVYGSCGTLQCKRKSGDPKLSDPSCYAMVERDYKFYFSFENSYCKDYSTEKLYNALSQNVVPVVYGAGDYSLSAPPNSVINVESFENVTQLVEYLKYLNEHDEEYLKYFEWKKHYRLVRSLQPSSCQLCEKLNEQTEQSVYDNLEEWWWGREYDVCKVYKNLPRIVRDLIQ